MRKLTQFLLSKFISSPRLENRGINTIAAQTNIPDVLSQYNIPAYQQETENWIISKLTHYRLNSKKHGENIIIENFSFEDDCLVIHKITSLPQLEKNETGTFHAVTSLDCTTVIRISIKSFIKITTLGIHNQQPDNEITFITDEGGIEEQRECSFNMNVLQTSRRWSSFKSTQKTFSIPFDISSEKEIISQLNYAFKKLRSLYERK